VDVCFSNLKLDKHRELPPHPNVVQVFGISLDGPQPVIVMEYCAGGIKSNQITNACLNYSFDSVKKINSLYLTHSQILID
jgi:hypothetical protein